MVQIIANSKINSVFCVIFISFQTIVSAEVDTATNQSELPPCKACTTFTNLLRTAFKEGNKTPQDALDIVCDGATRWRNQCLTLRNQSSQYVTQYWDSPEFFEQLCIYTLQVCCPPGHFGPTCMKCDDCSPYGKCKGVGTRKGNGKCACQPGYAGDTCRTCAIEYYESYRDNTKFLCSKCHPACGDQGCDSAGPKGCLTCKPGWRFNSNTGCSDINECLEFPEICRLQQFCVNNDGSYVCLECDRSCAGCDGDGPDMCKSCASGYSMMDGKCTDESVAQREHYVNMTRFFTYFGLCVATCVIFQSSTTKACLVGVAVAAYIAASEYWLNSTPAADFKPQLDNKKLEELLMNLK